LVTNPDIKIKPFTRDDQKKTKNLINEGLGEHWGTIDPTQNPDLDNITTSYQSGSFLVAWLGSDIVGTGALIHYSDLVGQIARMSVAKHQRRLGIGTRILDALVQQAKHLGFKKIILETTHSWDGVIQFYLANGFVITHEKNGDVYFSLSLE